MRISDWSSDVCSSDLTVTKEADRMGLRLDGPVIEHTSGADLASEGLVTGCIQIPGNGPPLTLMRSEERRVRTECVSPTRSRCSPYQQHTNQHTTHRHITQQSGIVTIEPPITPP